MREAKILCLQCSDQVWASTSISTSVGSAGRFRALRRAVSPASVKWSRMRCISLRLSAQVFSRLACCRAASSMPERATMSTVSLASPVTLAACGAKPGSARHSSRLLMRKRWIRVLQSRSRLRASTCSRQSGAAGSLWMRYCTAVYTRRLSRGTSSTRAAVSRAVRASLSVTPGRKPTSTNQSGSGEGRGRGSSEAHCKMGSCQTPSSSRRRT